MIGNANRIWVQSREAYSAIHIMIRPAVAVGVKAGIPLVATAAIAIQQQTKTKRLHACRQQANRRAVGSGLSEKNCMAEF